jgi:O-antigen ligase
VRQDRSVRFQERRFADPAIANFWVFAVFLTIVFLMGGGSRADILSQPIVRIVSIVALAIWSYQMRAEQLRAARTPFLFLGAAILVVVVQLVPLPPSIWGALPGHGRFESAFAVAQLDPVWRPLSLTPDRGLNALLAFLPPLAAAAGMAVIRRDLYPRLVTLLIGLILLSVGIAIVQISTGQLYLFRVTNEGSAVGLFANRNHQALLLAMAFPLLGFFATERHPDRERKGLRGWVAGMIGALLVPMLLVTGSRAGLFLGLAGGVAAFAIAAGRQHGQRHRRSTLLRPGILIPLAIMIVATFATIFLARDVSLQRLAGGSSDQELRTQNLGLYLQIARDFMPFGTGLGAFDPVYRMYEPLDALRPTYLNHAHNDFAEIAIEAGIAGLVLAAVFLFWVAYRSLRVWLWREGGGSAALARTGSAMVLLVLAASLVDYPLRTPIHATLLVIAAYLILPRRADQALELRATSSLEHRSASTNSRTGQAPNVSIKG